jgi:hypothetical protein
MAFDATGRMVKSLPGTSAGMVHYRAFVASPTTRTDPSIPVQHQASGQAVAIQLTNALDTASAMQVRPCRICP